MTKGSIQTKKDYPFGLTFWQIILQVKSKRVLAAPFFYDLKSYQVRL